MKAQPLIVALLTTVGNIGQTEVATSSEPTVRHFTILAAEPKGGANVDQEAFPTQPLPEGSGYMLKEPNAEGRWEVSTYVWLPSQLVVTTGDKVVLDFVGINGASHRTEIEGLGHTFTLTARESTQSSATTTFPRCVVRLWCCREVDRPQRWPQTAAATSDNSVAADPS